MKLITINEAIKHVHHCLDIPATHEIIYSGIYRNAEPNMKPYFRIELEWNKIGEPRLDEDELVNPHTIRAELDAVTGKITAYYRHDRRNDLNETNEEMSDEVYEEIYPNIIGWIHKLDLTINTAELYVTKKLITNHDLYEVQYVRAHNGIRVSDYQMFNITLDHNFNLIHLSYRWDSSSFTKNENPIPLENFVKQFNPNQLSLFYHKLISPKYPYYAWRENIYDAVTGELIREDKDELIEVIDMDASLTLEHQPIVNLKKPIFTTDSYNALKLPDHTTNADPYAPHPFYPLLTDDEVERAKDIAVSCLRQSSADKTQYQYAFINKLGHPPIQSMLGNQIQVTIHRMLHGVGIGGAGIRFIIDRESWALNNTIDALKMFNTDLSNDDNDLFLKPTVSIEEAWSKLQDKVEIRLRYKLETDSETQTSNLRLVYILDSDWVCNAITVELTQLT
ncbi:hypothetical protein NV379_19170 [Paenibacillus sp. N1-5-1-14]|uniref:hypothetical protein n=1 Tax=Paenibacillus radicibacter TaxID=2972488 RepID=UPI002158AFEA|nr:hypothetical protein [Paenibacillus radicibacter]MCR8644778.1 hypothetical protein [Paenibacillus radicibacter]